MKSKQKLIHVIQLCGRKKGMLYITVVKIRGGGVKGRGLKSRIPANWSRQSFLDIIFSAFMTSHTISREILKVT